MDKNSIKKYAVWSRRELIERVSQRAMIYGITAKNTGDPNAESVNGHLLSQAEKRQRQALIRNIKTKGYEQVMEEVAYTWFNRFAALRFMEVNGYLPSHIRVFTNDAGEFKPQILAEAIHLELDGLDMNKVYELESANKSEELFKYLLIVQCNALNSILPGLFQRIEDYTELLLPDYLLREGSVIEQMVTTVPEEDWTDQVQIIGWLYQYYNTEPKDKVFADLKKNIKITKENIPAATQLFTPDWIVQYMVENSLGRLWLEGHPNDALKSEWIYYLDEAEQEPEVQTQLFTIRKEYAALKPEEIRVIDPCMGSGHILCVLFDVLVRIYEDYGYTAREAAVKIVENNLWGLDIDERAAQLSYFAVMMKARQYDRRFFTRKVQPHVYAIEESNGITSAPMHDMGLNLSQEEYNEAIKQVTRFVEEMHDAKEYGSIIHVTQCDWDLLRRFAVPREEGGQLHLDIHGEIEASASLQKLINIGQALAQEYDTVVTNPPYMGSNGMGTKLTKYCKEHYPNAKADLFACCMEKAMRSISSIGYVSMITMESWMFLSGFEKMRRDLFTKHSIVNLVHMPYLGKGGTSLGINFGTAAFVFDNQGMPNYNAQYNYIRYYETDKEGIPFKFPTVNKRYKTARISDFRKVPGIPVAYWFSSATFDLFENEKSFADISETKSGLSTTDNNRFVRLWEEVNFSSIGFHYKTLEETADGKYIFIPHQKGGEYRKWYGNLDYIVNWYKNGEEIRKAAEGASGGRIVGSEYYLREGLTWTDLTSTGKISVRFANAGTIFNSSGPMCFCFNPEDQLVVLGYMNSVVANEFLKLLAPTFHFNGGPISKLPFVEPGHYRDRINYLVGRNIAISQDDWNDRETSWDFKRNPLVTITQGGVQSLKECLAIRNEQLKSRYQELKANEEELNRIFIDLYGLNDEFDPQVDDENVTVSIPDNVREIKALISYAVGCMFGRYSLEKEGLIFAGEGWNMEHYGRFKPDADNIIPVSDDEYFSDDIVGKFVRFISDAFGQISLEENLNYIAQLLGGKGSSRSVLRAYFMGDFFKDHCSMYSTSSIGKRPIYWLFDSGKKNGFKCLIYMHRYQPDTIARIRTDYVHEQQSRYRTAIADLEQRINGASTSERVKLSKQLVTLQAQAEEIRVYEEKIHHLADQMIKIDLDDGVKHNYEIFKDVLAKIK